MKDRVWVFSVSFICFILFLWLMVTIATTGPRYKCVNGIVYENYMSDDVWIKTKKECVEMK